MAELKDKFFGSLSGKFGDIVYRKRNGTNYISKSPKAYTVPDDELFQNRTGKFKLCIKFSSFVNSIPVLKNFWKLKLPPGKTVYQFLITMNYPFLDVDNITGPVKIIPDDGFGVRIDTCTFNAQSLVLNLNAITALDNINIAIEKKIQLIAVVFLNNPLSAGLNNFEFFKLTSEKINLVLDTPFSFNILLSTADSDTFTQYQNKKLFCTLVTYDVNDLPVSYAKTFSYNI